MRREQVLGTQRTALGRLGNHHSSGAAGGITAGIAGRRGPGPHTSGLAVVGRAERGTIPATDIEGAISAEHQVTDRVARELLAPIMDQHLDVAGSHWQVGGVVDLDPGELCRDHATVRGAAGYVRALVAVDPRSALPHLGRAPGDGEGDTVGVEHVDERLVRVVRMY